MTLVLTELSSVGIVMAADSAITYKDEQTGVIKRVDKKGWPKLVRVPRIKAAVSYWGTVGAVTKKQFNLWLKEKVIDSGVYNDLPSFADHLAEVLNKACRNAPLETGQDVGVHVAGYHKWEDGIPKPTFFHVHNGHGTTEVIPRFQIVNGKEQLVEIIPQWTPDPRKLFEKHQDFPSIDRSLAENILILQSIRPPTTRNGDYFIYSVVWEAMSDAFDVLNLIPGVSIPRDPGSLRARKDYVHMALETIVLIYQYHQRWPIIGGTVSSLAIGPDNYLMPIDANIL
jgi:hypothetical protein